jgi:hypothetical protein
MQTISDVTEEKVLPSTVMTVHIPCKGGLYMVSPGAHRWLAGASWASDGRRVGIFNCGSLQDAHRKLEEPTAAGGAGARLKRAGAAPRGGWGPLTLTAWASLRRS